MISTWMEVLLLIAVSLCMVGMLGVVIAVMHELRGLHDTMNSRLDELLVTTKALARAEGFKAGQENHLQSLRDFKEK